MIVLEYVLLRTGAVLDRASWQGEGPIGYATGRAKRVLEGLLQRGADRDALASGEWSNGYVQLRRP